MPEGPDDLGYLTAGMMWQLQGDPVAASAFLVPAGQPELNLNTGWQNQAEKNLSLVQDGGGRARARAG